MRSAVLVLTGCLGLSAPALAENPARDWFEKMGNAVESLNYHGVFVHIHDGHPETLEILHKVENDRVFERLTSRTGPGREIIRHDDEVRCIFQARKQVLVDWQTDQGPLRSLLPVYREDLERYYKFDFKEKAARIANRMTNFVGVRPRDEFRYGYRLWLDAETAMPLACELVDERGAVVETIHFTEIDYDADMPDSAFLPRLDSKDYATVQAAPKASPISEREMRWRVGNLPDGFTLSVSSIENAGDATVEHHVYTDGLAAISVFAEPYRPGHDTIEGPTTIGVTNAFGRLVEGYQITVVGEVPPSTVRLIGSSVAPRR